MLSPANVFNLQNDVLHISYSTGALGSILGLTYHEAPRTLTFKGDQLRKVLSDLGDQISVTLQLSVDAGSSTFTLFVPKVAVQLNNHVNIETIGITALHRSVMSPMSHAQLDTYSVTKLRGSASSVAF